MKLLTGYTVRVNRTTYDLHCIESDAVDRNMAYGNKVFKLGENYLTGNLSSAKLLSTETGLELFTVEPPSYSFDSIGREFKTENLKKVKNTPPTTSRG